ncbi:hypothetical protein 2209_scaffold2350_00057 [Bacteriophage sp.]|nr:hypothetical protein 2209_scaffold2350_00057 [Bacteriophage sp.]
MSSPCRFCKQDTSFHAGPPAHQPVRRPLRGRRAGRG